MRHLPILSALPAFEATVRLGSVSAAARELGRTHSAISKQIRHMSEDLGVTFFDKKGTGIVPNDKALKFGRVVASALSDLSLAASELRAVEDDNAVDVAMSVTLATRWLTPRLPRFYALHPEASIRLRMSGPNRLETGNGLDVLLSYDRLKGPLNHENLWTLGDAAYGPVCARGFAIQRHGKCATVSTKIVQPAAGDVWHHWSSLSDIQVQSLEEIEQPHHILALEAAAAGLGIALAEKRLVEDDIESGRLIAPFGFVNVSGGFQAAVLVDLSRRQMVGKFLNWLRSEVREDQPN